MSSDKKKELPPFEAMLAKQKAEAAKQQSAKPKVVAPYWLRRSREIVAKNQSKAPKQKPDEPKQTFLSAAAEQVASAAMPQNRVLPETPMNVGDSGSAKSLSIAEWEWKPAPRTLGNGAAARQGAAMVGKGIGNVVSGLSRSALKAGITVGQAGGYSKDNPFQNAAGVIEDFKKRTGADPYATVGAWARDLAEPYKEAINAAPQPVAWLGEGLIDAVQGLPQAGAELLGKDVDAFTRVKALYAGGQAAAVMGMPLAMGGAMLKGMGAKAAGEVAGQVGSMMFRGDVLDPVFDKGIQAIAKTGIPGKVANSARHGVLAAGLNRPIFDDVAAGAYDAARKGINDLNLPGVSKADSGAFAGLTAARAAKMRKKGWVPTFAKADVIEGGAGTGAYNPATNTVLLADKAHPSTVGHELMHAFRQTLDHDEERIVAQAMADHAAAKGVTNYDPRGWSVDDEEFFAQLADQWLRTGEAPTPGLSIAMKHIAKAVEDWHGGAPVQIDADSAAMFVNLVSGRGPVPDELGDALRIAAVNAWEERKAQMAQPELLNQPERKLAGIRNVDEANDTIQQVANEGGYSLNVRGDAATGDEIVFLQKKFGGSFRRPTFEGYDVIEGKIVSDSYGKDKGQHTFTIERPDGTKFRIKGRNLYDEAVFAKPRDRQAALDEKHIRGDAARAKKQAKRAEADEQLAQYERLMILKRKVREGDPKAIAELKEMQAKIARGETNILNQPERGVSSSYDRNQPESNDLHELLKRARDGDTEAMRLADDIRAKQREEHLNYLQRLDQEKIAAKAADDADPRKFKAYHNTTVDGLLAANDLGGIPHPSLAIVKAGDEFERFGNVTLVGKRNMVDPETNYRNQIFNRDAYSQRQPMPAYKVNRKEWDKITKRLAAEVGHDYYEGSSTYWVSSHGNRLSDGNGARLAERLTQDSTGLAAYIKDRTGVVPDDPYTAFSELDIPDKYGDRKRWAEETIAPALGAPMVKTKDGWVPYSLDTVSAAMNVRVKGAEKTMTESLAKQAAKAAKEFPSVPKARAEYTSIDAGRFEDFKRANEADQEIFIRNVKRRGDGSLFDELDNAMKVLGGLIKKRSNRSTIDRTLSGIGIYADEAVDAAERIVERFKDAPTEYFEAKPGRPVALNEFAGAVVPNDLPADVMAKLKESGLPIRTYDPDVPGSRKAAAQAFDQEPGVLFQPKREAGMNVPSSMDERLDPFSDKYDPKLGQILDHAIGDGSEGSGVKALDEVEAEISRLNDEATNLDDKAEMWDDIDRDFRRFNPSVPEENKAKSTPKEYKTYRRNKNGRWVPTPGTAKLYELWSDTFGTSYSNIRTILDMLQDGIDQTVSDSVMYVPLEKHYALFTRGHAPTSLREYDAWSPRDMLTINFSDDDIDNIAMGQFMKEKFMVPYSALHYARRKAAENVRDARKFSAAIAEEITALEAELRKKLRATEREFTREEILWDAPADTTYTDAVMQKIGRREKPEPKKWEREPKAFTKVELAKAKVRDTFVENMTLLRSADPASYIAARAYGSSSGKANAIIRAGALAVDKAGGAGTMGQIVEYGTLSRLIGIYDRWKSLHAEINAMDSFELVSKVREGEFDAVLETLPEQRKLMAQAAELLNVQPGSKVAWRDKDGKRFSGVLLKSSADAQTYRVQTLNGKIVILNTPPTPIGWEDELNEFREDVLRAFYAAQQNVGLVISGKGSRETRWKPDDGDLDIPARVEEMREVIENFAADNAPGLEAYRNIIEPEMSAIHQRNNGVSTAALGPLNVYVPLSPTAFGEAEVAPRLTRERPLFNRPDNPRNKFASGQAASYDLSMESFNEAIKDATKTNNKAKLMDTLREAGLMVDDVKRDADYEGPVISKTPGDHKSRPTATIVYPSGYEVPAVMVNVESDRIVIRADQSGLPIRKKATQAAVPIWVYDELIPAFNQTEPGAVARMLHSFNAFGMVGPADAYFHAINVLNVLRSMTPYAASSKLGKAVEMTPVLSTTTKWFTQLFTIIRQNASDESALKEIMEMADYGALPSRYGQETTSAEMALSTGAELKGLQAIGWGHNLPVQAETKVEKISAVGGGLGVILNGVNGVDARARLIMWRVAKEIMPDSGPIEWADFVNQLGAYNTLLSSTIERTLKQGGIAPFYTAGSTMLRNGVNLWLGKTRFPGLRSGTAKQKALWAAQQMSGGAAGALLTWAILHKTITAADDENGEGTWPWEEKNSLLFMIPVPKSIQNSSIGDRIWGSNSERPYMNMAFFLAMPERGARGIGLKGYADAKKLGASEGLAQSEGLKGLINSAIHPVASSPAVKTATQAVFGADPYIAGLVNRQGQTRPELLNINPTVGAGLSQVGANIGLAAIDANQILGGAIRILAKVADHEIPEPDWLKKSNDDKTTLMTFMSYAFPRLLSPPRDLDRKRDLYKAIDKALDRETGGKKASRMSDILKRAGIKSSYKLPSVKGSVLSRRLRSMR